jgi:hypothetical protein
MSFIDMAVYMVFNCASYDGPRNAKGAMSAPC